MKQYEQQLGELTIEESASKQVEDQIIRENNEDMKRTHEKLSHVQYVKSFAVQKKFVVY